MKKAIYILLICFLSAFNAYAQLAETIIVGEIYDAYTGEPIPNVNITIQGTAYGTITNAEGLFMVRKAIDKTRTMVVSAVGYQTQRFRIEPGQQAGVDIALQEKVGNLEDIFVYPGANPALPIIENVRNHRQQNRREVSEHNVNRNTAVFVSDIQSKHLQKNIWKSLKNGMITKEDSSFLIPLYWQEQKADSIQEKAALLTTTDYQILLSQIPTAFDFYDNNLPFISTSILSPLSAAGNTYYQYFLVDSINTGTEKHYVIRFHTKNPFYATLNGEMTIDSATYALRSIHANIPPQTSINFLRQLTIKQEFTTDNYLQSEDISVLMDFAIKQDTSRIFPTLLIARNTRFSHVEHPAMAKDFDYSMHQDLQITEAMDSISNTALFKTAKFLAHIIQTGCIPTNKYVEVGKIHHVLRLNNYEGLRVGIPLQTTANLWKDVSLEAFIAYGTKDRAWKGMGQMSVQFPTERRHIMRMRYSDEYIFSDVNDFHLYLRENNILSQQINIVTRLMQGVPFNADYYFNPMVRRQEARIHFEDDWNNFLETQTYVKIGKMGYGQPTINYYTQPSFFYATLGASARISFDERKVDYYFHRRHIYNHLPVLYFSAEMGSYQTPEMNSYRMYGNLQMMLRQKLDLGLGGKLDYLVQAGIIFGKVPFPLLHIFSGNQTYTFDTQRFTLMNTYQYAADHYLALQAQWNGNGILFNLIPGIQYLQLRELLELKIAWGGMRNNHQSVLEFPTIHPEEQYSLLSAPKIPYIEAGIGIGNILRIGEIYSIWRLTHLKDPASPFWSIRFRLSLGL